MFNLFNLSLFYFYLFFIKVYNIILVSDIKFAFTFRAVPKMSGLIQLPGVWHSTDRIIPPMLKINFLPRAREFISWFLVDLFWRQKEWVQGTSDRERVGIDAEESQVHCTKYSEPKLAPSVHLLLYGLEHLS